MTFDIRQDRAYLRAPSRSTRYLVVRLAAPDARRSGRLPVNVSLVLDRSGSMGGPKIRLAKEAVGRAIATLDARDRFSVVFYDDTIDVVVPSTPATADARAAASEALQRVDARGSTNLFGGWMRGCEQVALNADGEVVSRSLLLTDGLANVGVTDRFELETHAAELRRRGVATSTFGVGHDFDEALLEAMASAGGGNFYYIQDARQIGDFMTSELGEALEVVARDVRLEVTLPLGTQLEILGPERVERRAPEAWSVEVGDLVARQDRELVLRLSFASGRPGDAADITVMVQDRDGAFGARRAAARWIYADHATNDRRPAPRGRSAGGSPLRGAGADGGRWPQQGRRLPACVDLAPGGGRSDPELRAGRPGAARPRRGARGTGPPGGGRRHGAGPPEGDVQRRRLPPADADGGRAGDAAVLIPRRALIAEMTRPGRWPGRRSVRGSRDGAPRGRVSA